MAFEDKIPIRADHEGKDCDPIVGESMTGQLDRGTGQTAITRDTPSEAYEGPIARESSQDSVNPLPNDAALPDPRGEKQANNPEDQPPTPRQQQNDDEAAPNIVLQQEEDGPQAQLTVVDEGTTDQMLVDQSEQEGATQQSGPQPGSSIEQRPLSNYGGSTTGPHVTDVRSPPGQGRAEKQAAEEATKAFIATVAKAVQTPLAATTGRRRQAPAPVTPTILRRSHIIARNECTSTVRPSKRGEVLLIRKLGIAPADTPISKENQEAYEQLFRRPLSADHLAAIRDLFPAAQALSDSDHAAALLQAGEEARV